MLLDKEFEKIIKELDELGKGELRENFREFAETYTELEKRVGKLTQACKTWVEKLWDYRRGGIDVDEYTSIEKRIEDYIEFGEGVKQDISKLVEICRELERRKSQK